MYDVIDYLIVASDLQCARDNKVYDTLGKVNSGNLSNRVDDILHIQGGDPTSKDNTSLTSQFILASDETCDMFQSAPRLDVYYPDKIFGHLVHEDNYVPFIGPDREPVETSTVEELVEIGDIVLSTGLPNYKGARIPLKSNLNIKA